MAGCLAPAESLEPRALLSAGDLDPSFGVGGKVTTEFLEGTTTSVVARATALQADGKIVAAGEGGIARYMPNGSLEFTFGVSGRVEYPFAARSVAIQSDGKIVVGGGFGQYTSDDFVVSRYLSNGMPDTAFDGDGRFLRRFGTHRRDAANAVPIQADGRIVLTGLAQFDYASYVAVARYNTDGSTDTGFGQWGCKLLPTSTVTNGQNPGGGEIAIVQPDGKLLTSTNRWIQRINSDGSSDNAFSVGGELKSARLQPDGKLSGRRQRDRKINGFETNKMAVSKYDISGNWKFFLPLRRRSFMLPTVLRLNSPRPDRSCVP